MSVNVIARVLWTDIPDLDGIHKNGKAYKVSATTAKITMVAIADSADDFGENSYNSIETLAKKTSLKRRSVPRVVRALEQNGWCFYRGLSVYGTNNYSVNMTKLGFPPEKRATVGRPKTSDSSNILPKTSDSSSQKGYLSHPNRIKDNNKLAKLTEMYEQTITLASDIYTKQMLEDEVDNYPLEWFEAAFKVAVEKNARNWSYVKAVLKGWKDHYFGWKPGDRQGQKPTTPREPVQPQGDDGREMTKPEMLKRPRIAVEA